MKVGTASTRNAQKRKLRYRIKKLRKTQKEKTTDKSKKIISILTYQSSNKPNTSSAYQILTKEKLKIHHHALKEDKLSIRYRC